MIKDVIKCCCRLLISTGLVFAETLYAQNMTSSSSHIDVEIGGLWGVRQYDNSVVSKIAQSDNGFGVMGGISYRLIKKPRVGVGIKGFYFVDEVFWRTSLKNEQKAQSGVPLDLQSGPNGERKKWSAEFLIATKLHLLSQEWLVDPYIGLGAGYFRAKYQGRAFFSTFHLLPEFRPPLTPFEIHDYKGWALNLNLGMSKRLGKLPFAALVEAHVFYHTVTSQTPHLPEADEDFDYYTLACGIDWIF